MWIFRKDEVSATASLSWRCDKMLENLPSWRILRSDYLTAQHLCDILASASASWRLPLLTLLTSSWTVTYLCNYKKFLWGRLIALQRKDRGIRPIAVGYALRCFAAKYANSHVIKRRRAELQPVQVGAGGCEEAAHAVRSLVDLGFTGFRFGMGSSTSCTKWCTMPM